MNRVAINTADVDPNEDQKVNLPSKSVVTLEIA